MTVPSMTPRERFVAACRRRPVDRPPAWMMRQAGRYLPEYRDLRAGYSFLEMVRTPEAAAEITCQPVRRFGMDAAVIFSDILIPPDGMGLVVDFVEGKGPVLSPPVRTAADVDALHELDVAKDAAFLGASIRLVRAELGEERAIIGFCGAPFTVASYMIEGSSSRNFEHTKQLMLTDPEAFDRLLTRIVDSQIPYLALQVEAGADAVQIFDSWGGALDAETYRLRILPHLARLVAGARALGVPVIAYVNGCSHLLEVLAGSGADVIGIDWRVSAQDAIARVGATHALQGNLDPCTLFAPPPVVEREARKVLDAFAGVDGYIFNLGSGILPKTPLESVEALFRVVLADRSPAASGGR